MTVLLLAASPTPAPAPTEMEPWEVSPGLEGFLLGFFLLALAVVPLFLSMAKHMRRVDHNERLRQRAEEQAAEADGGPGGPLSGDAGQGSGSGRSGPGDGGAPHRVVQSPTDVVQSPSD